jgi:hypothetical protein
MRASGKLFFGAIFIFCFFISNAQNGDSAALFSSGEVQAGKLHLPTFGAKFNWETNSNALTNGFLLDVFNLHITRSSIDNSELRLKKNGANYFLNRMEGGVYYVQKLKKAKGMRLTYELAATTFQEGSFGSDAFRLVMYGNAHYKNRKLDLGRLAYNDITYQRASIGFRKSRKQETECIEASIGFVVADYANRIRVSRASIFTEENGEYIDVDLAYDRRFSSPGAAFNNPKAVGAAFNAAWYKYLAAQKTYITIRLNDLGFARYGPSSVHQTIDTAIRFSGLELGDISNISSFKTSGIKDSLISKTNYRSSDESFNFMLPGMLNVSLEKQMNAKSSAGVQVTGYTYRPAMLPNIRLSYFYLLSKALSLGSSVSTGPYAKFDLNLHARYSSHRIFVIVDLRSVDGMLNPTRASGAGAFAHLGFFL